MIETLNEVCILLIMYVINLLIDPVIPVPFRTVVGKIICLIASINMASNVLYTAKVGFYDLHEKMVTSINHY